MIEPLSFKLTILKELMTENPLRQNLARKRVPSLVVRPLTLRTSTLFGAASGCGRVMAPPRAGLQVLALSAEGMFQGQDPGPERGRGQLDAVWMKGTGLTLRAGVKTWPPAPASLRWVSLSVVLRFLAREAGTSSGPNHGWAGRGEDDSLDPGLACCFPPPPSLPWPGYQIYTWLLEKIKN